MVIRYLLGTKDFLRYCDRNRTPRSVKPKVILYDGLELYYGLN